MRIVSRQDDVLFRFKSHNTLVWLTLFRELAEKRGVISLLPTVTIPFCEGVPVKRKQPFVCFPQLDTPSTPGVFVFTMKWGHAYADLSLFV